MKLRSFSWEFSDINMIVSLVKIDIGINITFMLNDVAEKTFIGRVISYNWLWVSTETDRFGLLIYYVVAKESLQEF